MAYLLGVGYPADRPLKPIRKPNRRPFDEVVHHGHWSSVWHMLLRVISTATSVLSGREPR